jgi:tetratricopeptide (TPR) repeat protein
LKRWDEALKDYRHAIRLDPGQSNVWVCVIDLEVERGHANAKALTMLTEAKAAADDPTTIQLYRASQSLLANRRDEYEQICRDLAGAYADSDDPDTLRRVARAAALSSQPVIEGGRLVEIAGRAVAGNPVAQNQSTLGLCLLRDGQADAAIEQFARSLGQNWDAEPLSWLGLAIAHAKVGRDDEATDWLHKAQRWFQKHPLDLTSEFGPNPRLACQLLLREAEQLSGKPEQEWQGVESKREAPVSKPKPKDANTTKSERLEPKTPSNA